MKNRENGSNVGTPWFVCDWVGGGYECEEEWGVGW